MGEDTQRRTVNRNRIVCLIVFLLSLGLAAYLFFLIQILNSYPFWDYINGYRLSLYPFTGVFGDITYPPFPFQFVRYSQLFDISVALAFIGLFVWQLSGSGKVNRKTILSASGFTLLVMGTICAVIVYLQIDVLNWQHLPWGQYSWGSERVAYNTQFLGAEYNCTFLNYTQLLYIAVSMAIVGFFLWNHYSATKANLKASAAWVVAALFAVSFAFLISGLFLLFPTAKFSFPDPTVPATPYAIQATFLVWTGAAFLMVSIISFCKKLKQAFARIRIYFKNRGTSMQAAKTV